MRISQLSSAVDHCDDQDEEAKRQLRERERERERERKRKCVRKTFIINERRRATEIG